MTHSQASFIIANQVWFNLKEKNIFSYTTDNNIFTLTDKGKEIYDYHNKRSKSNEYISLCMNVSNTMIINYRLQSHLY